MIEKKMFRNLLIVFLIVMSLTMYVGTVYLDYFPAVVATFIAFIILYCIFYKRIFWVFIFFLPFLPPYFAIQIDFLPIITASRVLFLLFFIDQLIIKKKFTKLVNTINADRYKSLIVIYLLSILISGCVHLYRNNITGFVGSLSVLLENVLLYYLVSMNIEEEFVSKGKEYTLNRMLNILCTSAFILSILALFEYSTHFNVFTLLDIFNSEGINSESTMYIRQGKLRVTSSFVHSLGYGLYLLLMIPVSFYQFSNSKHGTLNRIFYFVLSLLLLLNIFLTYSRSTIAILFAVSFGTFFILSKLKMKIYIFYSVLLIGLPMIMFSITPYAANIPILSSVGDNVKSLVDTFLGTHLATDFGKNSEPFTYRLKLIEFAFFEQNGINNWFGKGIGFIRTEPLSFNLPSLNQYSNVISNSVDNYYVNVKLETGWIGLVGTLVLIFSLFIDLLKKSRRSKFGITLLVAFAGYFAELVSVNELYTIQYFWILFALFSVYYNTKHLDYL